MVEQKRRAVEHGRGEKEGAVQRKINEGEKPKLELNLKMM